MYFSGNYHYKKVYVIHQCIRKNRLTLLILCLFLPILQDYRQFSIVNKKLEEIRRNPVSYLLDNRFFHEFLQVFPYLGRKMQ